MILKYLDVVQSSSFFFYYLLLPVHLELVYSWVEVHRDRSMIIFWKSLCKCCFQLYSQSCPGQLPDLGRGETLLKMASLLLLPTFLSFLSSLHCHGHSVLSFTSITWTDQFLRLKSRENGRQHKKSIARIVSLQYLLFVSVKYSYTHMYIYIQGVRKVTIQSYKLLYRHPAVQ